MYQRPGPSACAPSWSAPLGTPRRLLASLLCVGLLPLVLALVTEDALAGEARASTEVSRAAPQPPRTLAARTTTRAPRYTSAPRTNRGRRVGATAAQPLTAMQLAGTHGFTVTDEGNHVLLTDGGLRLHLYPGRPVAIVAGREYKLKDTIRRRGSDVLLSSRVVGFLTRKIREFRVDQQRLSRSRQARVVTLKPLPPLPPKPAARPTRVKPAARPKVQPKRQPRRNPAADRGWAPSTSARAWKWIVLHHSDDLSGNVDKYDDYHRNVKGWENGCGYHFVVGNGSLSGDGEVEIGPRWHRQLQGAHAKVPGNRYNERGIGICLVGDFEKGRGPSRAQMDGLVRLVRWLMARYDISPSDIRGHCDCCSTCCPGRNFPWAELRRRVAR